MPTTVGKNSPGLTPRLIFKAVTSRYVGARLLPERNQKMGRWVQNVPNTLVQENKIRTKTVKRTDKTVSPLLLQHLADVAHAADGELIIVELVSRRGSCIHNIIALLLLVLALGFSWSALRARVML